jgi:superfamily I DNA and/or RNA helicase
MPQIFSKPGSEKGKITLAVITPYREHARQLRSSLASVRDWGLLHYDEDSVATIDSFQGKEKDIVIFSAVRTSRSQRANLKFLEDLRRLNVAFSRARHKLFLVADGAMLERADRNILSEHGKQVFSRFLDRFNDASELQHAWRTPNEVQGDPPT